MLIYEKKGPVANITLNRPEAGNAIDSATEAELDETLARITADDEVRVIVFRGAGESFSVGEDLRDLAQGAEMPSARAILSPRRPFWQVLLQSDRISIAAIQGKCLGRGLELALACDLRIAAGGAEFGLPEVGRGMIPSAGGTQLLPRTVPKGLAMEMILAAQPIDAEEAYRIGLVGKLVEPERLSEATEQMVSALLSMAPIALKYAKEAMVKGLDLTLEQGMRLEADLYALIQTTEDRREGIKAFLERRPPRFVGR